jgi:hypothetical protein
MVKPGFWREEGASVEDSEGDLGLQHEELSCVQRWP